MGAILTKNAIFPNALRSDVFYDYSGGDLEENGHYKMRSVNRETAFAGSHFLMGVIFLWERCAPNSNVW